jgi:hypothetical protein
MRLWPPVLDLTMWSFLRLVRAATLVNLLVVLVDHVFFANTLLGQPIYVAPMLVFVVFAAVRLRGLDSVMVIRLGPEGMRLRRIVAPEERLLLLLRNWLLPDNRIEPGTGGSIPWRVVELVTVLRRRHSLFVYIDGVGVLQHAFPRAQEKRLRRVLSDLAPEQYQPDAWWNDSSPAPSYLGISRQSPRRGDRVPGTNAGRMPVQYFYLGERLLRELYGFFEVNNPSWRSELLELTLPVVKAQLQRRPSVANLAWVARKVTPALSDHTGTALYPGEYVRDELDMTWGVLPQGADKRLIAWFYSFTRTDEGLVFVALCGSVGNYLDYHGSPGDWSGWYPSSLRGMSEVVSALAGDKEDYDAVQAIAGKVFTDTDERFSREFSTLVQEAFEISRAINRDIDLNGAQFLVGQGRCELLFRVFQAYSNIRVHGVELRSAIVGAPVWVAPAPPRPLELDLYS